MNELIFNSPRLKSLNSRLISVLEIIGILLLVTYTLRSFMAGVSIIRFPYDLLNAVEASFVAEGLDMFSGRPLYVDPRTALPFISQMYFPGFPALLGFLSQFNFNPVILPRIVTFTAFIPLGFFVYRSSRLIGADRKGALIGAGLAYILIPPREFSFALYHNKIWYMLYLSAVIFSCQNAVLHKSRLWAFFASMMAFGATWFHQSALLSAVFLIPALWPLGWRIALASSGGVFLALGTCFLAMNIGTDGGFYLHSIQNVRELPLILSMWVDTLKWLFSRELVILLGVAWGFFSFIRSRNLVALPLVFFTFLFLPAMFYTSGKWGSGYSHVQVIVLGFSPFAALFWTLRRTRRSYAMLAPALLILLVISAGAWPAFPTARDRSAGKRIEALIQAHPGPLLTDRHLGWVLARGDFPDADIARLFEFYRNYNYENELLIEKIKNKHYSLILTSQVYESKMVSDAMKKYYVEIDRISSHDKYFYDFHILVPIEDQKEASDSKS